MGKGLLFFCCSCCILVLTIVNLSVGPFISGTMAPSAGTWNCQEYKDNKDDFEKSGTTFTDEAKKHFNSKIDWCTRIKGMHDMEYTAFIFDIVIGFICGLVGLLHLFDLKKDFVSNTGLIGLICGVIGFALTFVYVIFNGLVYTTVYTSINKRDGDYVFAEISGSKFTCLYYDDPKNPNSIKAKLSDLGKKQYNYNNDYSIEVGCDCDPDDSNNYCGISSQNLISACIAKETNDLPSTFANCKKLYVPNEQDGIVHKDLSDRFLTTLILSLVVCLANIGLALFGFLLFRTPGDF